MSARTAVIKPSAMAMTKSLVGVTTSEVFASRANLNHASLAKYLTRRRDAAIEAAAIALALSLNVGRMLVHGELLAEFLRKERSSWQARLALKGYELIVHDDGTFGITKWGLLTKPLENLDAVADFAEKVGA